MPVFGPMTVAFDAALDDAGCARLLLALTPAPPPAAVAARMLGRLRTSIGAADAAAGWLPLAPGCRWKLLHDDGRSFGWLLDMRPGAALPAHRHHDGDEECLVLSGEVLAEGQRLVAGDYQRAARGSCHADVRSDTGCLLYLRSPSARLPLMPGAAP